MPAALHDVLFERARQVVDEGWTAEHDDNHRNGELAAAAACYARPIYGNGSRFADPEILAKEVPAGWPWPAYWWKPKTRRRDLVRAAALLLAEIERLDRAEKPG
jgi:hypothetical protein